MSGPRKAAAAVKPLCVVTVDHSTYLLTADAGMKLAELLARAERVDRTFERGSLGEYFQLRASAPEVEWKSVRPEQLRAASTSPDDDNGPAPAGHRRIRSQPLQLALQVGRKDAP